MAENVIDEMTVKLKADTSGLEKGMATAKGAVDGLGGSTSAASIDLARLEQAVLAIGDGISSMAATVNSSTSSFDKLIGKLTKLSEESERAKTTFNGVKYTGFDVVDTQANLAALGVKDFEAATMPLNELSYDISAGLFDLSHSFSDLSKTEYKAVSSSDDIKVSAEEVDEAVEALDLSVAEMNTSLTDGVYGMKNLGENTEKAATSLTTFTRAAAALGIGKLFKKAITEAGDLEQNIGGAQSVFKAYSASIEETAKTAYQSLGLSESKYLATATKMGALFQGTGSSAAQSAEMTANAMKRAADVASIMGLSIDDAMYSISGMAKGNFTMMDNLGVAMNDTTLQIYAQEKGLGKLETTQQKVNAAYQMFMDKTEYAAQNYEKENDTYAGSLTTLKAEFENFMAEAGTAAMPIVTEGIKLLSGALQDVSPFIKSVAEGIGVVGEVLSSLPEPLVKTVAYVVVASTALKKLNGILSITQSKILVISALALWLIGKISEVENAANEAVKSGTDGADENINATTSAVDDLNSSLGETSKAVSKLAGFDEITKLTGGSSSLGSSIVSSEDVSNAANLADEIAKAQEQVASMAGIDTDITPTLDLSSVADTLAAFGTTIYDALFGDENEKYTALDKLNKYVENIFGAEWSKNWQKVGQDMYDIINGFATGDEKSVYQALLDLNDKIKTIPFFGDLYEKTSKYFTGFGQVLYELTNGNYEEAIRIAGSMGSANPFNNEEQKEAAEEKAEAYKRNDEAGVNLATDKELKVLQEQFETVTEAPKNAREFFDANSMPLLAGAAGYIESISDGWNDFWFNIGKGWHDWEIELEEKYSETPEEKVDTSAIAASSEKSASTLQPDRISAEDLLTLDKFGAASPINIRTIVELDGDKVGESVTQYQNDQTFRSNGMDSYN